MAIVRIEKLTGKELDWAVLVAEGMLFQRNERGVLLYKGPRGAHWAYFEDESASRDWDIAGHLLERHHIGVEFWNEENPWRADIGGDFEQFGATALEAICRCYVMSVLGPSVEPPDNL